MGRMNRTLAIALLGALLALGTGGAAAADAPAATHPPTSGAVLAVQVDEPATLRILNREVLTMRARLGGLTPQARVQRARERIVALPDEAVDLPLNQIPFNLGEMHGVQFLLGDLPLFSVIEGDADVEVKQSFDALVGQTRARLEAIRTAWHQARSRPLLLQGLLSTLVATLVLGVLVWVVYRVSAKAVQ
jgi:hypothetical protein